jgi:protein SCO1/2
LAGCSGAQPADPSTAAAKAAYHGPEPRQGTAAVRPSFVLQDTTGNTYDFGAQTRGRPTLLYFGYTSCPDECPTAMADIAAALRQTTPELRAQTRVVFVTTDPERDEAARLRRWLDMFSTEFVGLVGSQAEIDAAQDSMGLPSATKGDEVPTLPGQPDQHVERPGTAPHTHLGPLGYGVAHTNTIFAFDVDDRLPVVYSAGTRPSDIAADFPLLTRGDAP